MDEHFDAVIVGSGFGGAVMGHRLREAGLRVCLLERGKRYPPNSFARAPRDMRRNFWDPSEGLYGLFNVWSFKGTGALVSSGLGGGSLIYANVLIRKDEKWFVKEDLAKGGFEYWPVTRADLEPHYARVERMMNVQKYPLHVEPYAGTGKVIALREAAQKVDADWKLLNLAVSFRSKHVEDYDQADDVGNPPLIGEPIEEEHRNIHNMTRYTCRLCGECDIGCNYGSKNTLDYTYISAMHLLRGEVRTLCEVKNIEPRTDTGRGYRVKYIVHRPDLYADRKLNTNDEKLCPPVSITCDRLILSAGTFGTPYLLLKNAHAFPGLSSQLGSRYSTNGDLLSFLLNARECRDGKTVPRNIRPEFGPVIASAVRYGDSLDGASPGQRGFYVEDGGNPYLLSWASELSGIPGYLWRSVRLLLINLKFRLGLSHQADMGAQFAALLGNCAVSQSSMPVLTMGRDYPDGRLFLRGKYLDCDWSIKRSQAYYARVRTEVRKLAEAIDAEYHDNPSFRWNFHQVLTAHPLGGCPMATSKAEGVVDSYGRVFDCPGLYVADGSVLPGPVGPNPSLTIAALSDRFADKIIDEHKSSAT
jgi:cholesterol oxidase